jgi:hypothetical protein
MGQFMGYSKGLHSMQAEHHGANEDMSKSRSAAKINCVLARFALHGPLEELAGDIGSTGAGRMGHGLADGHSKIDIQAMLNDAGSIESQFSVTQLGYLTQGGQGFRMPAGTGK